MPTDTTAKILSLSGLLTDSVCSEASATRHDRSPLLELLIFTLLTPTLLYYDGND